MRKKRRRLWQLIVNNWRWCQQERDKRIYEAGIAHGRLKEREAMQEQLRPVFDATPCYIPVAMLPGPYESPERQTDPLVKQSLKSARQVAAEARYQASMTRPVSIPPHLTRKLDTLS